MTRQAGSFYAVTPGADGEPEFFPRTLEGVAGRQGAMQRAIRLSADGTARQVSVTADGRTRVIFEYLNGRQAFRSCAGMVPAPEHAPLPPARPAAEVTELASRRQRPKRPRRTAPSWPALDELNNPPCNAAGH